MWTLQVCVAACALLRLAHADEEYEYGFADDAVAAFDEGVDAWPEAAAYEAAVEEMASSSKYVVIPRRTNQASAAAACKSTYGTGLATILSPADQRAALGTLNPKGATERCWIGLVKRGSAWKWADGSPVKYRGWGRGSPSGDGTCAELISDPRQEGWNDLSCTAHARCALCNRPALPPTYSRKPFYRYFKYRGIQDHFYTTNAAEIGTTTPGQVGKHGYKSEGYEGYLATSAMFGEVPLYRYWSGRDHFYTTNAAEIGTTTPGRRGRHGYTSEGVAGYCQAKPQLYTTPLYRYWNPRGTDHFYTTNWAELGRGKDGWHLEGIACYVYVPNKTAAAWYDISEYVGDYGVHAAAAGALAVLGLVGWQAYRKRRARDGYVTPGDEAEPLL